MAATIMRNEYSRNTEMYLVISIKIASNKSILNSGIDRSIGTRNVFLFSVQKMQLIKGRNQNWSHIGSNNFGFEVYYFIIQVELSPRLLLISPFLPQSHFVAMWFSLISLYADPPRVASPFTRSCLFQSYDKEDSDSTSSPSAVILPLLLSRPCPYLLWCLAGACSTKTNQQAFVYTECDLVICLEGN